jgi:two-component system, OmpR family, phosphate regulon sensor histidine kinase PhoR
VPQGWWARLDGLSGGLAKLGLRLGRRRGMLGFLMLLTAFFVLFGGLSTTIALSGLATATILAALYPNEDRRRSDTARALAISSVDDTALGAIVDAVPEPIIVLDAAGRIDYVNRRASEVFQGLRLGQHVTLMSRDPELLNAIDDALQREEVRRVELHERIPIERRLFVTIAPLRRTRQDDATPTLIMSLKDLTEQDSLGRMRADFVANASHELRTPLASLKGFVETLQGSAKNDPSARERFLAIMNEQATRMTRLIDDLLSLSRVEMRVHLPPSGLVELNDTVAHVIQALEPLAKESRIALALDRLEGQARVLGDRDELVQVFQNLIQNAIKYGKPGGHANVRILREDVGDGRRRLAIVVADDGPGIAPEHLPRLTERFYRVNVAASREKGGTGLGLAIVKHIVNRHRGELRISSKLGEGATFTVLLNEAR